MTGELPGLDQAATAAFALVALVGRARPEVAGSPDAGAAADLSPEALAEALARARKALRRKLHPLPGSGWCERAERMISDRLDDALEPPGPARLDVHLANCERCVEHERRLGQAQDTLVAGFEKADQGERSEADAAPAEPGSELPPALRVVDASTPLPPASEPEALPAPEEGARELPPPEARVAASPAPAPVLPASPAPRPPAPAAHPTVPAPKPPPPPMAAAAPYWPSAPRYVPPAAQLEVRPSRGPIQESEWTSIGPLLAVLFAAVSACLIALLLAL